MTPDTDRIDRAAAMGDERLRHLIHCAREYHGAVGCKWVAMPPNVASSKCAECGRSSTAHVIDKLCDQLELRLLVPPADAAGPQTSALTNEEARLEGRQGKPDAAVTELPLRETPSVSAPLPVEIGAGVLKDRFGFVTAEGYRAVRAADAAGETRLRDALFTAMRLSSPFHPGAARDPEGVWWDCDWCNLPQMWTKDRHEIPVHPDNGCPVAVLKAALRDAAAPVETPAPFTQDEVLFEVAATEQQMAAVKLMPHGEATERVIYNGLRVARMLRAYAATLPSTRREEDRG